MRDFGTIRPGQTLDIFFATYSSDDPSASITMTGLAVGDIKIYRDGSTTERASTSGFTLLDTDGTDFDGLTGIHGVSIDLSDNTDSGFYRAGSRYTVVVSSVTVDAATISFVAGSFRIGYADAMLNTTIASLSTQTSFTLTNAPAEASALVGCPVVIHDVASAVQIGHAIISAYAATTKTVTLAAATTFTVAAGDNIAVYPPSNTRWAGSTIWTSGAITAGSIASSAITSAKIASSAIGASQIATDAITAAKIAADAIGASELATDAVQEIRNAITGGAYALNTDANGSIRLVDGTGTGELSLTSGFIDGITGTANTFDDLNDLSTSDIDSRLAAYDAPTYDEMLGFFQLTLREDAAINTDRSATLIAINTDEGSGGGAYDNTADAQEAIRGRGDAAWVTGGGASLTQALNVVPVIPASIDLANTSTVRIGLILVNSLDDLPSTAEITPGTISIERKAIGGTSWSAVVTDAAMSEQAGMVYYDETFDSGSTYSEGDSLRITFKSVSITADSNTHEVCDSNGLMFQTYIRETMRGTDGANTTTPPTVGQIADQVWDEPGAGHTTITTMGWYLTELYGDLTAVVSDTNELQTDWTDGGRLDLILDTINSGIGSLPSRSDITGGDYALNTDANGSIRLVDGTGTGELSLTLGLIDGITGTKNTFDDLNDVTEAGVADAVWDESTTGHTTSGTFGEQAKTDIDAILSGVTTLNSAVNNVLIDTNELQSDWTDGGRLDLILDAINSGVAALPSQSDITGGAYALNTDANGSIRLVDGTGTGELSLTSGLIDGITGTKNTFDDLNDIAASDILTTQLTESYAANGVVPTLSQAMLAVHQKLMQREYAGTASNVYQFDNATLAFAGTLDSSTTPTEDRRA